MRLPGRPPVRAPQEDPLPAHDFAALFERHRPVLRRQAGRLLRGSGHDPDDVLQDVYLRADAALRGGVVPIDARAWLLRLVRNACLDELRRAKVRAAVGDIELETLPANSPQLPEVLIDRTEARALLGDIHRLPDRQKSVLVMNALDGLSHEEVAVRLDTTVDTTRSLLARARANLRQTAAARETSCVSVRDALDAAISNGVRASEIARRHLWSCSGCRAHQAALREQPSRLRRLAGWSPWGVLAQLLGGGSVATVQKVAVGACCALVVGGGAATVPVIKHHAAEEPQLAMVTPEDIVVGEARERHTKRVSKPAVVVPVATTAAQAPVAPTAKTAPAKTKPAKAIKPRRRPARFDDRRTYSAIMNAFFRKNPSPEERKEIFARARRFMSSPKGSKARSRALMNLSQAVFLPKPAPMTPPPPKGLPAPTATPVPVQTPAPTPVATATPVPVVETPVPTATATPEVAPTMTPSPVAGG